MTSSSLIAATLTLITGTFVAACTIQGPGPTDDDAESTGLTDDPAGETGGEPGAGGAGGVADGGAPPDDSTGGGGGDPTAGSGGMASGGGGGAPPLDPTLDPEEAAFLQLINAYRGQNGLGPVAACRSLNDAAQAHSEDMRDNDYFSHTGLNMSTPWQRACQAGYQHGCGPTTAMAENIAAGNSGAQATFNQWKASPGHNANMLGSGFAQIGIGRAPGGGTYGVYWTNVFGGSDEPSCE